MTIRLQPSRLSSFKNRKFYESNQNYYLYISIFAESFISRTLLFLELMIRQNAVFTVIDTTKRDGIAVSGKQFFIS